MSSYLNAFLERVGGVGATSEIQKNAGVKTAEIAKIQVAADEAALNQSFGRNGTFGMDAIAEKSWQNMAPIDPFEFEERAGIVEYDLGVPRDWGEGFARLDCAHPPSDVPAARWRRFIDDCGVFLDGGWAGKAAALGWGPFDLFGCNGMKPWARIDQAGLLWLLNGSRLLAFTSDQAIVETVTGARQTYRRRGQRGRNQTLAWDLDDRSETHVHGATPAQETAFADDRQHGETTLEKD